MNAFTGSATAHSFLVLLPELVLIVAAVIIMTSGAFVRLPRKAWSIASTFAVILSFFVLLGIRNAEVDPYATISLNDSLSFFARAFLLFTGLILLGLAHDQVSEERAPEFFGCILLILGGSLLVATANELVFLFAGLELISIPTYILLYLPRREAATLEAATKYFYLSIFSSALLLFGMAYLYGLTGVSNFKGLAFLLRSGGSLISSQNVYFGLIAVLFMMAGFGFRIAAVPFHFYAPDVYQGSSTVVAALLAWLPKAIGFLAIIRSLSCVVSPASELLANKAILLAWILAVATMTLANTVALLQTNLKRLLAYSSVSHAGYLLIGTAVAFNHLDDPNNLVAYHGNEAVLFYLVTYAVMTLGAFGILLLLNAGGRKKYETIDDMAGLAQSRPIVSLAMAICLFSLAGIPPFAGFWGKFLLFASAWTADPVPGLPSFRLLTVIGVLNAAVGAFYYLRILMAMYFRSSEGVEEESKGFSTWPKALAVGVCVVLNVWWGLAPAPVQRASRLSAVDSVSQPVPGPHPSQLERTEATASLPGARSSR